MITKLTANREITNYAKEDVFNFKIKADAIKSFLEYNVGTIMENKMMALYGDWGSGKTSMMKYIEAEIDKDIYFPIFFHAWEFEKDENLALSLCEVMTETIKDSENTVIREFKENAIHMLKGFFAGTTVKIGGNSFGAEMEWDGTKMIEGFEKSKSGNQTSYFAQKAAFKKTFKAIEDLILANSEATRIIVFVDDLDRCEPENVLNLITALKLFFTYGEHSIFMAGLDKDAVNKAVLTKYKDVVKSEEYLEKVFDITFSVPKIFSLEHFLSTYFKGEIGLENETNLNYSYVIDHFFRSIHFTNPRKIKKVLNKYEILSAFKKTATTDEVKELIPNILNNKSEGDLFETIFCLFFIILYENYPNEFQEIEDYNRKVTGYMEPLAKFLEARNANVSQLAVLASLGYYTINDVKNVNLDKLFKNNTDSHSFIKLLFLFSHPNPSKLGIFEDSNIVDYNNYFLDNGILTLFCKFLIKYKREIEMSNFSNYVFWNYFEMAKYLL